MEKVELRRVYYGMHCPWDTFTVAVQSDSPKLMSSKTNSKTSNGALKLNPRGEPMSIAWMSNLIGALPNTIHLPNPPTPLPDTTDCVGDFCAIYSHVGDTFTVAEQGILPELVSSKINLKNRNSTIKVNLCRKPIDKARR